MAHAPVKIEVVATGYVPQFMVFAKANTIVLAFGIWLSAAQAI